MKSFIVYCLMLISFSSLAQNEIFIVPEPASVQLKKGNFILNEHTTIQSDAATINAKQFLLKYLGDYYKLVLKTPSYNKGKTSINDIQLRFDANAKSRSAYTLEVNKNNILITGSAEAVFYGVQTLIQLLPVNKHELLIPELTIIDSARFSYRGMHLDVGRHFYPVEYIKKYIDFLALHKFNNFHWHLTEDQGWRIEIKKYPKLTEVGSCRNQTLIGPFGSEKYDNKKTCGFYTQDQIKDIVGYAAKRYINIIPEIEMPGHSIAALSSYPFLGCTKGPYEVRQTWGVSTDVLCAGNDSTYKFIEDVLDEVLNLFPSPYIHIGGDECPKERWHNCKVCQLRMKDLNLKNEHELQSYFVNRIEKYINSKGRKIIGWDEILEGGLAPNATVMSWRGEDGGIVAAQQNHFAIMTPGTPLYFDHTQSINEDSVTQPGYNSLKSVYEYEPIPKALKASESKYILGAQANMWTEYMGNENKIEYMLFPRMTALSEVLWSNIGNRNWNQFEKKIPAIFKRYQLWNVNFSKAYYDIQTTIISNKNEGILWKLTTNNKEGKIIYSTPDTKNRNVFYTDPIAITESGIYSAVLKDKNHSELSSLLNQEFHINKATGKQITLAEAPSNNYSAGGVLTLADGIQNTKGMSKSAQFLGFWGGDLNAVVDLGKIESISKIYLHAFEQQTSWIYKPSIVSFSMSDDGINFSSVDSTDKGEGMNNLLYKFNCKLNTRFIKITARNFGEIPKNQPGEGYKAWLFVDEIEIY